MAERQIGTSTVLPSVGMVTVMLAQTSNMVVSKVAMTDGLNKYVMVVYSFALSTLLLLPCLFLPRSSERPPLTFSGLCSFFLLALFGGSSVILCYAGIELSSPTVATALLNLIPAFTFVLALIFRIEKMHLMHSSSQAKVLGTAVSIGGAFVVIFYKGPPIFRTHFSIHSHQLISLPQRNSILGGLLCVGFVFLCSLWYIYQAPVSKKYPDIMIVTFFQIFFSTIQSALFAFFIVTDNKAWVPKLDMGLVAILYQAIVAIVVFIICLWCVEKAGPLFCTMFKPLGIIFTVVMDAIFLGDDFQLGSLVGAVITVVGFYGVIWGKATEEKKVENLEEACGHNTVPLLQNYNP